MLSRSAFRISICGGACAIVLAGSLLAVHAQEPAEGGDYTFGTSVVIPGGFRGEIFRLPKDTHVLPRLDPADSLGVVWTTALDISPRHWQAGFPGVSEQKEWFAINYTGRFWIKDPGLYKFALLSDDGSNLYVDGQQIIDNDCVHSPDVRQGSVNLSGGVHRIRVAYFQGPRDCLALMLAVARPGQRWRIFSMDEFAPPSNPETWSSKSSTEITQTDDEEPGEVSAAELEKLSARVEKGTGRKQRGGGCTFSSGRNCGN